MRGCPGIRWRWGEPRNRARRPAGTRSVPSQGEGKAIAVWGARGTLAVGATAQPASAPGFPDAITPLTLSIHVRTVTLPRHEPGAACDERA